MLYEFPIQLPVQPPAHRRQSPIVKNDAVLHNLPYIFQITQVAAMAFDKGISRQLFLQI